MMAAIQLLSFQEVSRGDAVTCVATMQFDKDNFKSALKAAFAKMDFSKSGMHGFECRAACRPTLWRGGA
jgi:hypothetical protein